ncbi:hypothetical protein Tco_1516333 [Tanacetum coccineum]
MDDPDITMEEYVQLETKRALRNGKVYNWETATYGKIWYDKDVHYLRSFETEFPAIVYNDALASTSDFSSDPTEPTKRDEEFGDTYFLESICVVVMLVFRRFYNAYPCSYTQHGGSY